MRALWIMLAVLLLMLMPEVLELFSSLAKPFENIDFEPVVRAQPRVEAYQPVVNHVEKALFIDFWYTLGFFGKWFTYTIMLVGGLSSIGLIVSFTHKKLTTQVFYGSDDEPYILKFPFLKNMFGGNQRTMIALHPSANPHPARQFAVARDGQYHEQGSTEWSEESQAAFLRTRPRKTNPEYLKHIRNQAQAKYLAGAFDGMQKPVQFPGGPEIVDEAPRLPVAPPDIHSTVERSHDGHIGIGYDIETGAPMIWNLNQAPHIRIHGTTGSGKTTLAQFVIFNLIASGARVAILDRRAFKDYRLFEVDAQFIDTRDPFQLLTALKWLEQEHNRRDELLALSGVGTIAELGGSVDRIVFVLDEFFGQIRNAKREGIDGAILNKLELLTAEGRSSGIHFLMIDLKPLSENWGNFIRANTESIVGRLPKGQGLAAGYYDAYMLEPYTFRIEHEGCTIKSWPIADRFRALSEEYLPANDGPFVDLDAMQELVPVVDAEPAAVVDGPKSESERIAWKRFADVAQRKGVEGVRVADLNGLIESGAVAKSSAYRYLSTWRQWADSHSHENI